VSILPTFYEQLLRQNPFAKKIQTQIVSTLKLCKKHSCKKAARKILVKLTPGRDFFEKGRGFFVSVDTEDHLGALAVLIKSQHPELGSLNVDDPC
jgi:hypothetical protein